MGEKLKDLNEKTKLLEKKCIFANITIGDLCAFFIIYSVFGWIMESTYMSILNKEFTNRGFLFSPMCPIYGYGIVILILIYSRFKKSNIRLFIYSTVFLSMLEYVVSFALEAMYSMTWWTYSRLLF